MFTDPLIGRALAFYRLLEKIGEGGMGAVYRAEHVHLGVHRAVKVLPDRLVAADPGYLARFRREALAAIEIQHENVVRVFDAGEDGGVHFLVMEFVDGEPLSRLLERKGALPEREAAGLALQAAEGLRAALGRGFIHRDVKPSNLLVAPDGVLKVADFGLAKGAEATPSLTRAGEAIGTPHYMSPEQAEGKPADFRSDVYALGIVLYEMLTGERPYRAESLPAVLRMHCDAPVPDPCLARAGLSPAVGRLVRRMTAKDPADRFPSYDALCDALRQVRDGGGAGPGSRIDSMAALGRADGPAQGLSTDAGPLPLILPEDATGGNEGSGSPSAEKRRKRKPSGRKVKIRPIRRPAPSAPEAQGDPPAGIGFLPDPDLARTAPGPAPSNVPGGASKAPRAPDASRDARGNPVVVRDDGGRDPDTRRPCELWLPVATESGLPCVFEFVLVPPGSFRMGSPASERERNLDEEPVHEVAFEKPFYLGKYAVTQAQWAALTGSNPSRFRDAGQDAPVESVSWEDCREFLARLNARFAISGFRFRLPSEAEWEYSCRAGTWTRFHSGDSAEDLGRAGWFEGNSGSAPHAVGRKTPNAWGLYDLHGNVWEWCEDAWHDRYTGAPRDGSPWLAGGDPGLRVLRGGAWDYDAAACRSANRYRGDPSMRRANGGLRLVWAEESGAPASGSPREPSRSGKRRGGRAPR